MMIIPEFMLTFHFLLISFSVGVIGGPGLLVKPFPAPWIGAGRYPNSGSNPSQTPVPGFRGSNIKDIPSVDIVFNKPNIPTFTRPVGGIRPRPKPRPEPVGGGIPSSWLRGKSEGGYGIPGLENILNNPDVDPAFARPIGGYKRPRPRPRPEPVGGGIPSSWLREKKNDDGVSILYKF